MSAFSSSRQIKATRKAHNCEGCGKQIEVGSPAFYWAGDCEGYFYSCHMHTDCRAAESGWNALNDCWGDEYASLCMIRNEAEDKVWLIEAHPQVAARMGLTP